MFNPEKRAEIIRAKMMKDGKYLIPRIEGSGQEKDLKKVIGTYFRWKQYIGHHTPYEEEWLKTSLDSIWSSKFIGLSEGFETKPAELVKKLEFQNPAYSAAYAFAKRDGDPRNYNKVFAVQLSGCTYDCNYCYVPPEINLANKDLGKYFSAKEIVDSFMTIRKDDNFNVLRITGGEATTIVPEIIIEVYTELEKSSDATYLWIDTNLSTMKYLLPLEGDLKDVLKRKNVGMTGCFKGFSEEDFSKITGASPEFHKTQFETSKLLIKMGTDFYGYVPALCYGDNVEKKISKFVESLRVVNNNLPLRLEPLIIKDYPGSLMNIEAKAKQGRTMPKNDQRMIFDTWFNKVLPNTYSKDMLNKYCCEIPL